MGLLDEGRKLLVEKEKKEREREAAKDALYKGLHEAANSRLAYWVKELRDVKGKKIATGEKIKVSVDEQYSKVTIKAGTNTIVELFFGHQEDVTYDSDGGGYGNGRYYPSDRMRILLPYEGRYGKHEGGEKACFETLNEEDLAMFFAQCIKG